MTLRPEYLVPHLLTVIASIGLAWLGWKRPRAARAVFVALFGAASMVNLRTALTTPDNYLHFAQMTDSAAYRRIITGPFAANITLFVVLIAIGQALIAAGLCLRGQLARLAALGAILFFVAIAPLGVGSALPSTIVLAGAMGALLRGGFDRTLFSAAHRPAGAT